MYCMVPGQRLTVTAPPEVVTLFTDAPTSETRWMQERPDPVVALGRDKMNVHMTGVELRLKKLTPRPVVPNIHPEGTADLVLEAGRVCEVRTLDATPMQHRWLGRPARGKWVELDAWREVSADVLARSERLGTMAEEWMGLVPPAGEQVPSLHQVGGRRPACTDAAPPAPRARPLAPTPPRRHYGTDRSFPRTSERSLGRLPLAPRPPTMAPPRLPPPSGARRGARRLRRAARLGAASWVEKGLHPVSRQRPSCLPGLSQGQARSYAPQSAA